MPRYDYFCDECNKIKTLAHSWQEKIEECPECGSDLFSRVMSIANFHKKKELKQNHPTGTVVNQSIKDAKEELRTEKKNLRDRKR